MGALVVLEKPIDPREVVSTLEELLGRAKDGEFESFVAVCMRPDGSFMTRSSGYRSSIELVGALHFAEHDIVKASER